MTEIDHAWLLIFFFKGLLAVVIGEKYLRWGCALCYAKNDEPFA